jgi:TRAP-type C4-dicarboxylate transport system permease small subunit
MNGNANNSPLAILNGMASALDRLIKICYFISGGALAIILMSVLTEVFMRYFFNSPTKWSNDLCTWMMAVSIMFALPEITRTKGNIAIDVLVEKLPIHIKSKIYRVIAIAAFAICMVTVWICGGESFRQYSNEIATMWINPIPKWWISIAVPIGFLLCGIQFLREGVMPTPSRED